MRGITMKFKKLTRKEMITISGGISLKRSIEKMFSESVFIFSRENDENYI